MCQKHDMLFLISLYEKEHLRYYFVIFKTFINTNVEDKDGCMQMIMFVT